MLNSPLPGETKKKRPAELQQGTDTGFMDLYRQKKAGV
jgi:hypothetical protein